MPMMRACAEATRAAGVPTVVSLDTIMVDGTGMCGCCRVEVGGVTKFACVDGPDFDAHQTRARASAWGRSTKGIPRDYMLTGPDGQRRFVLPVSQTD